MVSFFPRDPPNVETVAPDRADGLAERKCNLPNTKTKREENVPDEPPRYFYPFINSASN
jgi:hypothetical protein